MIAIDISDLFFCCWFTPWLFYMNLGMELGKIAAEYIESKGGISNANVIQFFIDKQYNFHQQAEATTEWKEALAFVSIGHAALHRAHTDFEKTLRGRLDFWEALGREEREKYWKSGEKKRVQNRFYFTCDQGKAWVQR